MGDVKTQRMPLKLKTQLTGQSSYSKMGRISKTWSRHIDASLEKVITAIHASPTQLVFEFAGAGSQALAWLHAVGGSSRTILEATDRYAGPALIETIGFRPSQFTAPGVAQALAIVAFLRARHLAGPDEAVVGVGCTATIATDRTKRGNHRACWALYDGRTLITDMITLAKGSRTRQAEEDVVSRFLIRAIAEVCQVERLPLAPLLVGEVIHRRSLSLAPIEQLLAGELAWLAIAADDTVAGGQQWPGLVLLSGSFNPLHQGHQQMAEVARRLFGREVYFELPLVNAGKGGISLEETLRRRAQFADLAPLLLTTAPLFGQKAKIFPNSIFMVGLDTVERLLQLRFYENDSVQMFASFDMMRQAGCRFMVAGRLDAETGQFLTMADVAVPAKLQDLFDQIPEAEFRVDVSSTALRQRQDG